MKNTKLCIKHENPLLTLRGIEKEYIVEEYLYICEEATCSICLNILYDPISCKGCDNLFCTNCIEEWKKFSDICPNQCELVLKPINFTVSNMLGKVKLKCLNNKKGCCSIIFYKDLKKHIEDCEFTLLYCKCGKEVHQKEYYNHLSECKENDCTNSFCIYCKENINYDKQHYLKCKERTYTCNFCKSEVLAHYYKSHFNNVNKKCEWVDKLCTLCRDMSLSLINDKIMINDVERGN